MDRRGPPDHDRRARPTSRATFSAPGRATTRSARKRDEVLARARRRHAPGRRALAAGVLRRADRDGRLRAGGRAARRPHPRRDVGAVGAGGAARTAPSSPPTSCASSTRPRACSNGDADHRLLPHRRALGAHVVRAARAARRTTTSRTTTARGRSGATWSTSRSRRTCRPGRPQRAPVRRRYSPAASACDIGDRRPAARVDGEAPRRRGDGRRGRVRSPTATTEIGGSTVPRCSASQTLCQRARARGAGRKSRSKSPPGWARGRADRLERDLAQPETGAGGNPTQRGSS